MHSCYLETGTSPDDHTVVPSHGKYHGYSGSCLQKSLKKGLKNMKCPWQVRTWTPRPSTFNLEWSVGSVILGFPLPISPSLCFPFIYFYFFFLLLNSSLFLLVLLSLLPGNGPRGNQTINLPIYDGHCTQAAILYAFSLYCSS